jgi:hypothetical protein
MQGVPQIRDFVVAVSEKDEGRLLRSNCHVIEEGRM